MVFGGFLMFKRVCSLILALVLFVVPLLGGAGTVRAASTDDMASIIEKQVRSYAASINQSNAREGAAADLAAHGMTGRGKTLKMNASSPLTAVLMNSTVVQEGFSVVFKDVIQIMQQLDMQSVPGVRMSFEWYSNEHSYGGYVLTDSKEYPDNLDWMITNEQCKGAQNSYDHALEWMVGTCDANVVIRCVGDTGSEKTYKVTAIFSDRFDFSTANTSGFKKLLSGLGMRLFREFDWECTVSMNITVPYTSAPCMHTSGIYRWTYDGENRAIISDDSGSYLQNNTTHLVQTATDGTVHHYYKLDHTVRLYHDKPWVLEYDVLAPVRIVFSPVDNAVTKTYPMILQNGRSSLFMVSKDYAMAENENGALDRYYAYNYYGTKFQELYTFKSKNTYTFRLENMISPDGNNRIYLTATDTHTGEICLDRILMDDYYYHGGWMDKTVLRSEESGWLSGKDIYINYFGSSVNGFDAGTFELRIWENGEGSEGESYFTSKVTKPTCTKQGYTTYTCSCCGYSYQADKVKANGHSFGDWTVVTAPSCTETGEEQRTCKTCKEVEVRETAAKGHDYKADVTAPSCTEPGYTTFTCACGDSYVGDDTPALGHSFEDRVCTACGEVEYAPGDVDLDDDVDVDDVLALLWNVLFPDEYPIEVDADFDGNGATDVDDVLTLLWYVLFPEDYPLN